MALIVSEHADRQGTDFLSQGPTPDEQLQPDLTVAFDQIGPSEYARIARRYRYARDMTLLGLTALVHGASPVVQNGGELLGLQGEGVQVAVTAEAAAANPGLLEPRQWESRRQIKDRVYGARVAGREYIMKEHKTPRHMHTKKNGHVEGLTSREEFETARKFASLGVIRQGDIQLRWEKPVGYAEAPHYQFAVFEPETDLLEGVEKTEPPTRALAKEIVRSKQAYLQEYKAVRKAAKELYDDGTRNEMLNQLWGDPLPKYTPWPAI